MPVADTLPGYEAVLIYIDTMCDICYFRSR